MLHASHASVPKHPQAKSQTNTSNADLKQSRVAWRGIILLEVKSYSHFECKLFFTIFSWYFLPVVAVWSVAQRSIALYLGLCRLFTELCFQLTIKVFASFGSVLWFFNFPVM